MSKKLSILKSAVIVLFTELGSEHADKWTVARCVSKIKTLPGTIDDMTPPTTKESKKLLKQILATLEAEEEVDVIEDPKTEKAAPVKGKKVKATPEPEDDDAPEDDEEPDEDDAPEDDADTPEDDEEPDEDDEPAPAKKGKKKDKPAKADKADKKGKAFKRAGGEKGPGIIMSIAEFLGKGTKDKPITKLEILALLQKRFPDRDESSLKSTINTQVPNKLTKEKGLVIKKTEDGGYYLGKAPKAAK